LYPRAADRSAALAKFRRDIDVDVYQNYFVEPRASGERPRSARVLVSYRDSDRRTAVAVTRELAELVVARVRATRAEQSARAAAGSAQAARSLQQVLDTRYARLAELKRDLGTNPDPTRQVEAVSLEGSIGALEQQVDQAEKRATAVSLARASE